MEETFLVPGVFFARNVAGKRDRGVCLLLRWRCSFDSYVFRGCEELYGVAGALFD